VDHESVAVVLAQYIKEKGRKEGRQAGRQEGTQKTVMALVRNARKKGLSEEIIAQVVDIDVKLVRQVLKNEPVGIPVHLLSDI